MTWWLLQNLVVTTALVALVALVCRVGRLGPVARHALWAVVLIKFVTPPLVVWPWAVPDPFGLSAAFASLETAAQSVSPGVTDLAGLVAAAPAVAPLTSVVTVSPDVAAVSTAAQGLASSASVVWMWLLLAWAVGSATLLLLEGIRIVRLRRQMRSASSPDGNLSARVATLSARLNVQPVRIAVVADQASPAVWGGRQPFLIWPATMSPLPGGSSDRVDGLIVHELAHVKRRDHLVGWLELTAGIVWWWNPLFWYVRAALREHAEHACDAWVISVLPNGRRAYAESLLAVSEAPVSDFSSPLATVGIRATNRRVLERRLVMIMQGRSPLRLPFLGLCCLALVAAATLPTWAAAEQDPPPPPVPPVPPTVRVVPTPPPPPPPSPVPMVRVAPVPPAPDAPPPPLPPGQGRVVAAPRVRTVTPTDVRSGTLVQGRGGIVTRGSRTDAPSFLVGRLATRDLPADGQELIEAFDTERASIQEEADRKLSESRDSAIKALEALQEQYTRDGKLDEAIAIRDYLRAGGPNSFTVSRLTRAGGGGRVR